MNAFGVMAASVVLLAGDWPVFRGNPAQTGVAAAGVRVPLNVRWQYRTGTTDKPGVIDSTAAIVAGVVYLGGGDGFTHAIDLQTGQPLWKSATGNVRAPVSCRDGRVYVGDDEGHFRALEAANGRELWTFTAEGEITSGANFTSECVLFGSSDESLYCLNRGDGTLRWKFQLAGGPVNGTPVIAGDFTYVAGCDSTLHAIEVATGRDVGKVELDGQVGASAAVIDKILYVGTMTNQVIAVDLDKLEIVWRYEADRRKQPFFSSPAVTDRYVIIGSRDKKLHAIDRDAGRAIWTFTTEGRVESSPVVNGDQICFASQDRNLYVVNLKDGREIQRFTLDGPVTASPAVAGGCIVIGTESGTVYCFSSSQ